MVGDFGGPAVTAQSEAAACSEAPDAEDMGILTLRCAGVVIAAEAGAVRSPAALMSSHPHVLQLDAGAIAISARRSTAPFVALTPDSVFSAREAEWAIFADSGRTSAVVWSGTVTAQWRMDGSVRVLDAGYADRPDSERMERLHRALQRFRSPR